MIRAELERRPLLILCLGLILGITLIRHPIHLLFLLPAPWLLQPWLGRALLVGGVTLGAILGPGVPPRPIVENQFVDSTFEVVSMPQILPFGQSCVVEHGDLRMALTYNGPLVLYPGQELSLRAVAKPPNEAAQAFYESQNLVAGIEARGTRWRFRVRGLGSSESHPVGAPALCGSRRQICHRISPPSTMESAFTRTA